MGINMAAVSLHKAGDSNAGDFWGGNRGPDPFVDFLFVAPSEDETPEDAWFLRTNKNGGR